MKMKWENSSDWFWNIVVVATILDVVFKFFALFS